MHAVVLQVDLVGASQEEGIRMLHELVIPHVKAQPGFVRGAWLNKKNTTDGMAVIAFETEDQAAGALEALKPPSGGPTLRSIDVYEVMAEA